MPLVCRKPRCSPCWGSQVKKAFRRQIKPFRELVQPPSQVGSRPNLRFSDNCTFLKLRTRTKFAKRAFCISGPAAWNALPSELRLVQCKDTFKRRLKTFYPRDAMLARVIAIATCLSVCPSVRPSRAGIVSKRRKLAA